MTSPYVSTQNMDRFIMYYFRDRTCASRSNESTRWITPLFEYHEWKWYLARKNDPYEYLTCDDCSGLIIDNVKDCCPWDWMIRVNADLMRNDRNTRNPCDIKPSISIPQILPIIEKWIETPEDDMFIKDGYFEIEKFEKNICIVCGASNDEEHGEFVEYDITSKSVNVGTCTTCLDCGASLWSLSDGYPIRVKTTNPYRKYEIEEYRAEDDG